MNQCTRAPGRGPSTPSGEGNSGTRSASSHLYYPRKCWGQYLFNYPSQRMISPCSIRATASGRQEWNTWRTARSCGRRSAGSPATKRLPRKKSRHPSQHPVPIQAKTQVKIPEAHSELAIVFQSSQQCVRHARIVTTCCDPGDPRAGAAAGHAAPRRRGPGTSSSGSPGTAPSPLLLPPPIWPPPVAVVAPPPTRRTCALARAAEAARRRAACATAGVAG